MKKQIRNRLASYLVQKEIRKSHRKATVVSFDKVKTIGILYDATSDRDYEMMKSYVRQLMAASKEVMALGFYNRKELPNTRFMKLGLDFFTAKSLNWKMKPFNPIVNNFIGREFDLLIVFNLERIVPLSYIANEVSAGFKIGKFDPVYTGLFDFMIKLNDRITLGQMIDQVNHYLNIIRNEKHQEI